MILLIKVKIEVLRILELQQKDPDPGHQARKEIMKLILYHGPQIVPAPQRETLSIQALNLDKEVDQ